MFQIRNIENQMLYPVCSNSYANIDNTLTEWIRFLSYIKPEDKEFLNELNGRSLDELTTDEIKRYLKIKEQKTMAELFTKYRNKDCTKKEHDSVYSYMKNSLRDFMKSRLTGDELNKSREILEKFRAKEVPELKSYIKSKMNNYADLTLVEAYILYEVKEIEYYKKENETNSKIRNRQKERESTLRKSLIKDYGLPRKNTKLLRN